MMLAGATRVRRVTATAIVRRFLGTDLMAQHRSWYRTEAEFWNKRDTDALPGQVPLF